MEFTEDDLKGPKIEKTPTKNSSYPYDNELSLTIGKNKANRK
jgi:hypothetical protein